VSILVRPYGVIRVDDGPPSAQPLAQHALLLAPGAHRVRVDCAWCEAVEEHIEVKPGAENVFRLRAQPKPSRVSFDFEPAEARVRVGAEERSARDSLTRPFEVRSPRGPAAFRNRVEYEVSHPGFRTERKVAMVEPGVPVTLHGELAPE
jgi:hypothetical protein